MTQQPLTDDELEARKAMQRKLIDDAPTMGERISAWEELKRLCVCNTQHAAGEWA